MMDQQLQRQLLPLSLNKPRALQLIEMKAKLPAVTALYSDIWPDLSDSQQIALLSLYYEAPHYIDEKSPFFEAMHTILQHPSDISHLGEIVQTFPIPPRTKHHTRKRRSLQLTLLSCKNTARPASRLSDEQIKAIQARYDATPLESLLPDIAFPLQETASLIAQDILTINTQTMAEITEAMAPAVETRSFCPSAHKSRISDSTNEPEATEAFTSLYREIIDGGTRRRIRRMIERLAQQGRSEAEIDRAIEEMLQQHQTVTLPSRVENLALHFNGTLSQLRHRTAGQTHYQWITVEDENVRDSHADQNGQIFAWDSPPPTGHPGEEFGCRCHAVPVQTPTALTAPTDNDPIINDPPIEEVFPEALLIPLFRLRNIVTNAVNRIRRSAGRVREIDLTDTRTWPSPPTQSKLREDLPSRNKPRNRNEKSLYDEEDGEWRYFPEDDRHNPHWDYKAPGRNTPWQNIPINQLPPRK